MSLRAPRRPRTRADCERGPRPCPWASCRHSLLADVLPDGRVRLLRDLDGDDDRPTCVLDVVAERGALALPQVADVFSVPNVGKLEARALARFRARLARELRGEHDDLAHLLDDPLAA